MPVVTHAKKERYEYQSWQATGERPAWPKADAVSVTFDATAELDDAAKAVTEAIGERLRQDLVDQDMETHAGAVVTYGDFESEVKGAVDDCAVKRHNFMVGGFGALLMVLLTLCGQHVLYEVLASIHVNEERVAIEKTISGTGRLRARPHEREGGGQPEAAAEPELLQAGTRMVLQLFSGKLIVDPSPEALAQVTTDLQPALRERADLILRAAFPSAFVQPALPVPLQSPVVYAVQAPVAYAQNGIHHGHATGVPQIGPMQCSD
jgi:hypothetical protein